MLLLLYIYYIIYILSTLNTVRTLNLNSSIIGKNKLKKHKNENKYFLLK